MLLAAHDITVTKTYSHNMKRYTTFSKIKLYSNTVSKQNQIRVKITQEVSKYKHRSKTTCSRQHLTRLNYMTIGHMRDITSQ